MSHKTNSKLRNGLWSLLPALILLAASPQMSEAGNIFEYHEDFHFLLEKGKSLYHIPKKIDAITPSLNQEVEIFAAADVRASAELLYTSTSMLLQQHATLVDVFSQTEYFKDAHIRPSIEILLNNAEKVRLKCNRYLAVVKRPELFQQILDLDEIAKGIEQKLGKYRPVIKPVQTDSTSLPFPKAQSTTPVNRSSTKEE